MTVLSLMAAAAIRVLAQVGVAVSAPAEVDARAPVLVKVEVTTPVGRDVRVEAPSFAPFRLVSATRVAGVDSVRARGNQLRAPWQIVEFRYVLGAPPNAAGRYTFDGFVARSSAPGLRVGVAQSRSWGVVIRGAPPASPAAPAIVSRVTPRPRAGISFHALAVPETVYVGQQSTYQVAVFLDEDVRARLRRNPEFLPPELRSMLAYDLGGGRTSLRGHVVDGRSYDVHVFQRAVFPLTPGRIAIPPAQLSYWLPLSSGFFSREESYTARAEPTQVVAVEPPRAGRPADWPGAVGVLSASSRVDTTAARAGDPLVFTVRVEGVGNVKLLPRPPLSIAWATAVASDERVTVDSTSVTIRGVKEFDWILTPRDTGARETPPVRYVYFDPYRREYALATAAPIPVRVTPGGALARTPGDSAGAPPPLPIRPTYAGAVGPPLPSRPLFWALVVAVPLPAVLIAFVRRPRRAPRARSPLEQLDGLARAERPAPADVRGVRRSLVAALGERLAVPSDAVTRRGSLARLLRLRGVTAETAADAERLLATLDDNVYAAASGGAAPNTRALAREARDLYRRVDTEARDRAAIAGSARSTVEPRSTARARPVGRPRRGALVLLVASATAAASTGAVTPDRAADAFARGVRAYDARQFARAQREFTAATAAEPRAADAWANAGTAAWAVGDTVAAAVGWQRALRLQPLASDLRARLALLPASQSGWIADVPHVSTDILLALAVGLWTAGWLAAVVRPRTRAVAPSAAGGDGSALGRVAGGLLVASVAIGVSAGALAEATRPERVAIVRGSGSLRAEPVLGAELGAPIQPTDVARVGARVGAWARVELDGNRSGWIEADQLAPLVSP